MIERNWNELIRPEKPLIETGAAFVSRQLNTIWGSSTTPATVAQLLDGGLPP